MPLNYRIPEHVISAILADEAVLLHMQEKSYFQLNITAQHIWKLLQAGADADEVVTDLVANFDIAPQAAADEYTRLTGELAAQGLVEAVR